MTVSRDDPRLHVYWAGWLQRWRVRGCEGDYGLARTRMQALNIAVDASVTASHWMGPDKGTIEQGERPIAVHDTDGRVAFIITRVRHVASSAQWHQDHEP